MSESVTGNIKRKTIISVAPMIDWTDRHCRYFHRLISPNAVLFTEMISEQAIIHGDKNRLLGFSPQEHKLVLQLGGSTPSLLKKCAKIAEDFGYDEININCGCPSERVQSGSFGACLMAEPKTVRDCISSIKEVYDRPVSVKCRTGIDNMDSDSFLQDFIGTVSESACDYFIIHARKAWLKGLSPKENREIPPLEYDKLFRMQSAFPDIDFHLNGGITDISQIKSLSKSFPGIMIGRAAYQNPWFLAEIEREFFNPEYDKTRKDIALLMIDYMKKMQDEYNTPPKSITRHMSGLYHGQRYGKKYRRNLFEASLNESDPEKIIHGAVNHE